MKSVPLSAAAFALISCFAAEASPTSMVGLRARTAPTLPSCASFQPFTYLGCYVDPVSPRALPFGPVLNLQNMTVETCTASCKGNGYRYAGLEYYGQCFCGRTLPTLATDQTTCNYPCAANGAETCGGFSLLSIYQDPTFPTVNPNTISDYASLGCYTDSTSARTLSYRQTQLNISSLTTEQCLTACKASGYPYAGTEYSGECYCDVALENGGAPASAAGCNMACSGNSAETCGGSNLLNLYFAQDLVSSQPCSANSQSSSGSTTTTTTTTSTTTTTTTTTTSAVSKSTSLPSVNGYAPQGCYTDGISSRGLAGPNFHGSNVNLETCSNFCAGWTYFGVENGNQCFCGNTIQSSSTWATSGCSTPCAGNSAEICGGFSRMSVYNNPQATNPRLVNGLFGFNACYTDGSSTRALNSASLRGSQVDLETCATFCASYGYFGVENYDECYCGNTIQPSSVLVDSGCEYACTGNSSETCGGFGRITIYGKVSH